MTKPPDAPDAPDDPVEALFDQAVGLPPWERSAFLDAACHGDRALRAEVEVLLACDQSAPPRGSLLDHPLVQRTGNPAGNGPQAGPAFDPPAAAGEVGTLGPYRVVRPLGQGGMGTVYEALDTRLTRRAALKVMLPQFAADPAARERFLREARAAAQVSHDNVVTVYEADERNGVPYIAMQLLEGRSLDNYLRENGAPPLPDVLRIAAQAADGLAAAHRIGLIHRDVKPANLWLEAPHGRVKVLDFGLAKPQDAPVEVTEAGVTMTGAVVGTPAYMSPEQARGEKVDHRTDLFSLGAVLYRLCGGRLPFDGPTTMAVLMALGTADPPPLRGLNPAVPEPLAELIHQMLAKKPDARPQSAADVATRMRAIAEAIPPPAVPPQVTTRRQPTGAAKPLRKKSAGSRRSVAAAFAALLAVVAAGVTILSRYGHKTQTTIKAPGAAAVTVRGGDGKTPAAAGPQTKQRAADAGPQRQAAEWVLSLGGSVRVNDNERDIVAAADLPTDRFALTGIKLTRTAATDAGLANVRNLRELKTLRLDHTKVTDAGLVYLNDLKELRNLLLGPGISDAGLAHLAGCTALRRIYLVGANQVTNAGLAHLKGLGDLTQLTLAGARVTDAGLAHLKGLSGLISLDVRNTKVTLKGLADFHAAVPGCTIEHNGGTLAAIHIDADRSAAAWVLSLGGTVRLNGEGRDRTSAADLPAARFALTAVNLRGNKAVTDARLSHLRGLQGLTHLDLQGTPVTNAGLPHLAECRRLAELWLSDTAVSGDGLANLEKLQALENLYLGGTGVNDAALEHVVRLKGLTRLFLQGTKVTDDGLTQLRGLPRLEHIDLYGTAVTNDGVAHLKDCQALTVVHLGSTRVTDAGLAHLKDVRGLTNLTLIYLPITDAGLEHLKDCRGLTVLRVGNTGVTDAGLSHLRALPGLTELQLNRTGVTDAGLAILKNLRGLTFLNLNDTPVTDAGLEHLAALKGLTHIEVRKTAVTPQGLRKFHAAVPQCWIDYDGGTIDPTDANPRAAA